ncbi:MAG: hypothetical protein J6W16_03500 [Methanobrevibacter sp.]|nr:hypothetical protein [Methanobrevibacter sp.]
MNRKPTVFEEKILPILNYVGAIGAAIMCIAYVVVVFMLINGFQQEQVLNTTIFACVNAAVGFVIMQFLKYQGVSFAQMIPENKEVLELYFKTKTKDKKTHSLVFFWTTSVIKDIIIKCATLAATSIGVIYIVITGSNDYNLLLLAAVNLLMFICFGFLSLVKAYNYFNQTYIEYIKERLEDVSVEIPQEPVKATEESFKEGE